jgi:hypothetical protein
MTRARYEAMTIEIKASLAREGERPTYPEAWDMAEIQPPLRL